MAASIFKSNICLGRVALITGGGSGIGYEIARQLGKHGASIILMGRREIKLKEAVENLQKENIHVDFISGDVRNEEHAKIAVEHSVKKFGHLDTLINGAAGNFLALPEDLTTKGFKTVMDIDTIGTFNMSHAAFPYLKESKKGKIFNISANLQYPATWYQTHASAAKAAIDSLTHSLALEWGQYGINVVGVAPGPIDETPGLTKLGPNVTKEMVDDLIKENVPIGRLGKKEEIASMMVYLTSIAGDYITGTTILIDGGQWLFKPPMMPREMVTAYSKKIEKNSRKDTSTSKL